MIKLSESLSARVKKELNLLDKEDNFFDFSELEQVHTLSFSKNDLEFVIYFKNIVNLNLDLFPSFSSDDVIFLGKSLKNVKSLKVVEQNAIFNLNLSMFENLEELHVIHNDNLSEISGLKSIKKFVFYDNKEFFNIHSFIDIIMDNKCEVELDILYYFDVLKSQYKIDINKIKWIESVGLRKFVVNNVSDKELKTLIDNIIYINSKYIYNTDGDIEKFGVLYNWMVQNIEFVNEDDPSIVNNSIISNVCKVFDYRKGGRLSFAKAFQLLLNSVGIKSSIVYSMGAYDSIGFYNGKKVYSLLGESDYALLRVTLNGKYYYCDISWDCMINKFKFFDELRLFLFSKEELKLRHKFVGEGNVNKSYSYHGDDSDDLIQYSIDRINEVDAVFEDIDRFNPNIDGIDFNIKYFNNEINTLKNKIENIDIDSEEYNNCNEELLKLEDELKIEESEQIKLEKQKLNVIENYTIFLTSHYCSNSNELLYKKNSNLISKYMFDILNMCFNIK